MKTVWRSIYQLPFLACSLFILISCGEMAPSEDAEKQEELIDAKDIINDAALNDASYIDVYPKGLPDETAVNDSSSADSPRSGPGRDQNSATRPGGSSQNGNTNSGNQDEEESSPADNDQDAADPVAEEPVNDTPAVEPVNPVGDSNVDVPVEDSIDAERPRLIVDQASPHDLIQIRPKEGMTEFTVGKHPDFQEGAYQVFARWSLNDQVKGKGRLAVQVNIRDPGKPGANCNYEETSHGDWRSVGIFYLSKNAQIKIHNKKQSAFVVDDSLMFVPVKTADVTKPEKFRCLDGQIDGFGLRRW